MYVDGFASRWRAVLLLIVFLFVTCTVLAEEGVLVLVVMDPEQHPFSGVRIGASGDGGSPQFTDQNGKARLKLAPNTKPAAWVTLQLLGAPNGLDLAFISPYDGRIRVPPFDNEQDNYDPVVVVKHGDKAVLESGSGMIALHATVDHAAAAAAKKRPAPQPHHSSRNRRNYLPSVEYGSPRLLTVAQNTVTPPAAAADALPSRAELQEAALAAAAQRFGLPVAEIQAAMVSWGGDPLVWKLILLTGTIDAGGADPFPAIRTMSNDIYFGVGSWSLGECSLQPVLLKFQHRDEKRFSEIMGPDSEWLSKTLSQPCKMSSQAIQKRVLDDSGHLQPAWRDRFRKLGYEHSFQRMQVDQMVSEMTVAQSAANALGLQSAQSLAFCYYVASTHGSNTVVQQRRNLWNDSQAFRQQIEREPDEQEKLLMLANRLIRQDNENGRNPVPTTPTIERATLHSRGQAVVLGTQYDLVDFGIGMQDVQTGLDLPLQNDPTILRQLQDGWIPSQGPPPVPRASDAKPPAAPLPESAGQCDAAGEKQLVALINQERIQQKFQQVKVDPRLTQAARKHTELLVAHKALSHQFEGEPRLDVRFKNENLPSDQEGENTAQDYDVPSAHKGLMDDPGHRAIILNPNYNSIGVCVISSGGYFYVTEDFAHLPN